MLDGPKVRLIPFASTCPAAWRCLMRHVSLHPSSSALPPRLRPRSNGHRRMPRQNRLRPSPRSRRKICRRAMGEEGGESLDHLVSAGKQRRRHLEAERSRGHKIDDEFELVTQTIQEVEKVIVPIPLSTQVEMHSKIKSLPFRDALTARFIVRPPPGSRSTGPRGRIEVLTVHFQFTIRSGCSVQLQST